MAIQCGVGWNLLDRHHHISKRRAYFEGDAKMTPTQCLAGTIWVWCALDAFYQWGANGLVGVAAFAALGLWIFSRWRKKRIDAILVTTGKKDGYNEALAKQTP